MTRVNLILARAANGVIGANGTLPWHLPEDLAHFKRVTLGRPIIMGRKTFDSIGRALPGRRNIVVTRDASWQHDGAERAGSLEAALAAAGEAPRVFVIGGADIFRLALPLADRLELTEIDATFPADTFFPPWPADDFVEAAREERATPEGLRYAFVTYDRRQSSSPSS